MQRLNGLFLVGCLAIGLHSIGQTKIIAHKSRSGHSADLALGGSDHFGRIIPYEIEALNTRVVKVEKISSERLVLEKTPWISTLNDTTPNTVDTVFIKDYEKSPFKKVDTFLLKKEFPNARFIGFDPEEQNHTIPVTPNGSGHGPSLLILICVAVATAIGLKNWRPLIKPTA